MPFDEVALTGKCTIDSVFEEGNLRRVYFKGDRLIEALERVEKVREDSVVKLRKHNWLRAYWYPE